MVQLIAHFSDDHISLVAGLRPELFSHNKWINLSDNILISDASSNITYNHITESYNFLRNNMTTHKETLWYW
jgi:hypothetical protein